MSRSSAPDGQSGFTLIELLVVVAILGLLAAIALPIFTLQRKKADDAGAKTNARNLVSHMHVCFVEEDGFSGCAATLTTASTTLPIGPGIAQVQVTAESLTGYTLVATSETITGAVRHRFFVDYDQTTGARRYCVPADAAGCRTDADGDGFGEW